MLKKMSLLVAAVMIVTVMFAALPAFADEAEIFEYVRFIAEDNDPYATFYFSNEGNNTEIDPDTVTWAAIRYRTGPQYDSTGVEYTAQFYINPATEPCIPVKYNFTGNWETVVVDMTTVNESTYLDSKWDSLSYPGTNAIRFDPLEPDRDSEDTSLDDVNGQVNAGDYIDIAWIAFFEKEEDAKAYTGKEDTPYCLLDVDSFLNMTSQYHISVEAYDSSEDPAAPTDKPADPTDKPADDPTEQPSGEKQVRYLYDKTGTLSTGWWIHPLAEDVGIDVEFTSDVWFKGIDLYAYATTNVATPMIIYLMDTDENVLLEKEFDFFGDNNYTVEFDDKVFAPGDYILSFVSGDVSEISYDTWFVLGSCPSLEDVDVAIMGGLTNDSTQEAPYVALIVGEADPNVTAEPTKAPTAAPTEAPTPVPTPVPTEKPADENDKATAKPADDTVKKEKNNKWVLPVVVAGAVVIAGAVAAVVIASAKKKKK